MIYLILLSLVLTPAYVLRFNISQIPTNILMTWVFLVWIVFFIWLLAKKQLLQFLTAVKNCNKKVLVLTGLFLLSGLVSLFAGGISQEKLGQFLVLFLQPISIFFIARFIFNKNPASKNFLLFTLYFILAAAGLYALLQYFTLTGLPEIYWGNQNEPKRALSFFLHPNFYALWSAPLLAFLIPDVFQNLKLKILNLKSVLWLLGALGLFFSISRAGYLGLAAATGVYLIAAADKKIRQIALAAFIIIVIVIVSIPNLRWRFTLPFYGEKSAVSRLSLWHTGSKAIKESPVLGLGLTGFSENWTRLNTDPNLDTHNFPHNIFLNFWVEMGLLGLISFLGLSSLLIYRGIRSVLPLPLEEGRGEGTVDSRLRGNDTLRLSIALFLICIITQGLLDNPYFKNDLAMVFWIILSLI